MMQAKYSVIWQLILLIFWALLGDAEKHKNATKLIEKKVGAKFDNPNFVRDRCKNEIDKPLMTADQRFRKPFNPGWMDYCDPYHCNDYHKIACGVNRLTMRFRWFQSGCHIILNNMCASYRGNLKYDMIETKMCTIYIKNLRSNCPSVCHETKPICSISADNNLVLFRSRCAMDMLNCRSGIHVYEEINMSICGESINTADVL